MAKNDRINTMNLLLPRAVIFDWDNTLVDTWPVITDALNTTFVAFGFEAWSIEKAREIGSRRSAKDWFPDFFGKNCEEAFRIFYQRVDAIHLEKLRTMPEAEELLNALGQRQIPLFVISNKRGSLLRTEAEHLGWTSRFVALIGSRDAEQDKPHRAPVDLALSRAGLKADDPAIWFVGDAESDATCARNSGCTPVLVHVEESKAAALGVSAVYEGCAALAQAVRSLTPTNTPREPQA